MTRHSSKRHSHHASVASTPAMIPGEPMAPYSETRVQPDAQWLPVVPIRSPLRVVQTPLCTSSETPAPQWAANVIIKESCTCGVSRRRIPVAHARNCWGGCGFLRTQWKDNVLRHVYGTNPFSDTVNSGGPHFQ